MERNVRLLVSYDGTDFHGWQFQPGLRTVEGVLRDVVTSVVRHPVNLIASGRTDAGVHATGQVVNFKTSSAVQDHRIGRAVQSRLPADVSVHAPRDVRRQFHATHSALSKLYRYRIHNAPSRPVVVANLRYAFHYWHALDLERMSQAAAHFVGTHDFTSMTPLCCVRETMVRTIYRCDVHRRLDEIQIDVEGSGFLYRQVRNMVGTLIEVGRGRWPPDSIADILSAKDRSQAGPTAPAMGLSLEWVRYPADLLRPDEVSRIDDPAAQGRDP